MQKIKELFNSFGTVLIGPSLLIVFPNVTYLTPSQNNGEGTNYKLNEVNAGIICLPIGLVSFRSKLVWLNLNW